MNVFLLRDMPVEMNLYFPVGNEICGNNIVVLEIGKFEILRIAALLVICILELFSHSSHSL